MPPRHAVLRCVCAVWPKHCLLNVSAPAIEGSLNFLSRAIAAIPDVNAATRTTAARALVVMRSAGPLRQITRKAREAPSKFRFARLPILLSQVREEPHFVREYAGGQGVDKNSTVAQVSMQSLPSAR